MARFFAMPLLLSLGSLAAGRRNGKVDDDIPSIVSSLHNMLEQHQEAMAQMGAGSLASVRANLQDALHYLGEETPGVVGGLTDVLDLLRSNVAEKIKADHNSTQKRVNDDVELLAQQVGFTKTAKEKANQSDAAWMGCVREEKLKVQAVVDAQNIYNSLGEQSEEECLEEVAASVITVPSSVLSFEVTCQANDDAGCLNTETRLETELAKLKQEMLNRMSTGVQAHTLAKKECTDAKLAKQNQWTEVQNAQLALAGKMNECKGKLNVRGNNICSFGERMQGACDAKATYDQLLVEIAGAGNSYSISDRVEEWHVTQMVMCLLRLFVDGQNITDVAIDACQQDIATDGFHIENKSGEVANILNVVSMPDFSIKCENHNVSFKGGIMHHWLPAGGIHFGYDGQVNSTENNSLKEYYFIPTWSSAFDLGNRDRPFEQCSSQQTCVEADFDCGKHGRIDDALCSEEECTEEECCSDEFE